MSTEPRTDPASPADILENVRTVQLPDRVAALADEYERVCGDRERFLWKWIHSLFPSFTLSSVPDENLEHVRSQKTVLTMYVTILDDLIERHGDHRTFEEARRLATAPSTVDPDRVAVDADYFAFIEHVWTSFERGLTDAPRRDEFEDVFGYDLRQSLNAVEYSAVVNETPGIANLTGARRYDAHNMVMFPYADVDLMYSPAFRMADFGSLRDVLWDLQEMARIGNWLTTWERELAEGDLTAGIVVLALQEDVVSVADLRGVEEGNVDNLVADIRDHDIERRFLRQWEKRHQSVRNRDVEAASVDLDALVSGMETVLEYHLASRGHK